MGLFRLDTVTVNLEKYARERNLEIQCFTKPDYPSFLRVRIYYTNMVDELLYCYMDSMDPHEFVDRVIHECEKKWFSDTKEETKQEKPQSYRDKLVEHIKLAGQDLIDRAESFVAADLDLIGGFNISIDFPQDGPIEISTKMNTYCKGDKYYKEWKETYDEVRGDTN